MKLILPVKGFRVRGDDLMFEDIDGELRTLTQIFDYKREAEVVMRAEAFGLVDNQKIIKDRIMYQLTPMITEIELSLPGAMG